MPPFAAYSLSLRGGPRVLALRALVGLTGTDPETRTTWVHLAYEGEWRGHPDGDFVLTRADFKSCIDDFEAQANPIRLDYDHASLRPPDGQPTPSAGYIQKLALRSDGLWALVEFTPRCAAMIRGGEQRFCSGVFVWERPDRKSGETKRCSLHSLAMTDSPFIDGQKPIVLSAALRALSGGHVKIKREALMELLEKIEGDEIEAEQLHAAVEAAAATAVAVEGVQEEAAEMADAPTEEPPPEVAPMAAGMPKDEDAAALAVADGVSQEGAETDFIPAADPAQDAGAMLAARLMEATGLDAGGLLAAIETNLDAVVAALQGAGVASDAALPMSVKLLSDSLGQANRELKRYREQERAAKDRALDAEIEALVTAGKILPGARAEFRALAATSLTQFRALAAKLPQVVPVGSETSGITAPAAQQLDNVIDLADPRVRAASDAMDRMNVKDPEIRKRRLAAVVASNRSAG